MEYKKNKGYTLIELLVVISIVGFLAVAAVYAVNHARAKARDTQRMADMKSIIKAIELFYDENDRYPGQAPNTEALPDCNVFGIGDPIDAVLAPFMQEVPKDPLNFNLPLPVGCTDMDIDDYFYGYDVTHSQCEPTISINRFETQAGLNEFGDQDTNGGGQLYQSTADYNKCFEYPTGWTKP